MRETPRLSQYAAVPFPLPTAHQNHFHEKQPDPFPSAKMCDYHGGMAAYWLKFVASRIPAMALRLNSDVLLIPAMPYGFNPVVLRNVSRVGSTGEQPFSFYYSLSSALNILGTIRTSNLFA